MKSFIGKEFYISILTIILLFGIHFMVFAQSQFDDIKSNFQNYREQEIQEQIYVHLSQNFLLTGETLWFKIYAVDATQHRPLSISRVCYVELWDNSGELALKTKVELNKGEGDGYLFLPASLLSGGYRFRAYTRWMRNFDSGYFFEKDIKIVNPFRQLDATISSEEKYRVDFFPEGGHLVSDLKSRLAFKITDGKGIGKNFSGRILNSEGQTVTTFEPLKFGMGSFMLTPVKGESYKAIINGDDNEIIMQDLPIVNEHGYVMRVKDINGVILVEVESKLPQGNQPDVYLFAHTRNIMSWGESRRLYENKAVFQLDKKKLHEGITHITLFNSGLLPVCERLIYLPVNSKVPIGIMLPSTIEKRSKASLQLKSLFNSDVDTTSLSISILHMDSLSIQNESSIVEYLGLTADLRGRVESPDYYFSQDKDVEEAIDNLMLTQGWRRFKWDNIINNTFESKIAPEAYGHIISGTVSRGSSSRPITKAFISSPDKSVSFYGTFTSPDDRVLFNVYHLYGPRKVYFQMSLQDSVKGFRLDNPFSEKAPQCLSEQLKLNKNIEKTLTERSIDMQIQDIYFEEELNTFTSSYDSMVFYGSTGKTYFLDDYVRFPVMEEVMREYVPEVLVRKKDRKFIFRVSDSMHDAIFEEEPLVLLDGVPILETDWIMSFDPKRIKRLDVFTKKFYLGDLIFSGMVSYSTYNGDLGGFKLDKSVIELDYEGLQLKREFFMPRYESEKDHAHQPDKRYLLYWNPKVVLESSKETNLDFFTSDVLGEYIIRVEGLSKSGLPAIGQAKFTVK